jgi:Uma2 family endonuclease
MTRVPLERRRYTVEEYFEFETAAETRHEYIDGRIIDMAGGTDPHSHITFNLIGVLWSVLKGKPCQARESNLRIRYGNQVRYGYPDASIFCGQPDFDSKAPSTTTLLNPRVLFEVLSPSTEAYDRGKKFEYYREIESLEEYVLIAQDRPSVDVYRRQSTGMWTIQRPYTGLTSKVEILSAGIEIPLAELYAGVEFPSEDPEESE